MAPPKRLSTTSSLNMEELNKLMKEYPDWKEEFPELYEEINPPRAHKNRTDRIDKQLRLAPYRKLDKSPKTDYQATYYKKYVRPRSTKKPPETPQDPNPPPMTFDTFQRTVFVPKDVSNRTKPVHFEDTYKPSDSTMHLQSMYQKDYPGNHPLPLISKQDPYRSQTKLPAGVFSDKTTTKEHYKPWSSQPSVPYKDLPVFTGSILYPEQSHDLQTTNMNTFKGAAGKRADPFILSAANIKLEGPHNHDTTNSTTYKKPEGARPATLIPQIPVMTTHQRGKLDDLSQTKHDYPGYNGKQPPPADPAVPHPTTIRIKHNNSTSFLTEQQKEYRGVDASKHPRPPLVQKQDEYKPNEGAGKFDAVSHVQADYKPIDVRQVYQAPAKGPDASRVAGGDLPRFEDTTMNKHFYKPWQVSPRSRVGDYHEVNYYVPPGDKFDTMTTTHETFVPKTGEMRPSYKPEDNPIAREGEHDFKTVNMVTYKQPNMAGKLDRGHAKFLLKELRQRKERESKALGAVAATTKPAAGNSTHAAAPAAAVC